MMAKSSRKSKPINPAKYALSGSEDSQQIALFMWAANPANLAQWPDLRWMFAIPNGGYVLNKSSAGRLKAMGLKTGVCDLMLPVVRGPWAGLFIEMKKPKTAKSKAGAAKPEQSVWISYFKSAGYGAMVCRSYDEAREAVISYLDWKEEIIVKEVTGARSLRESMGLSDYKLAVNDAFNAFSKAVASDKNLDLSLQINDASWSAWKRLCDVVQEK